MGRDGMAIQHARAGQMIDAAFNGPQPHPMAVKAPDQVLGRVPQILVMMKTAAHDQVVSIMLC